MKKFIKRNSMAGVGLVEVMISVLVLGVGMLGIAAMQATALRNSQSSLERSQAVIQAYTIFDAMRANLAVATSGLQPNLLHRSHWFQSGLQRYQ